MWKKNIFIALVLVSCYFQNPNTHTKKKSIHVKEVLCSSSIDFCVLTVLEKNAGTHPHAYTHTHSEVKAHRSQMPLRSP